MNKIKLIRLKSVLLTLLTLLLFSACAKQEQLAVAGVGEETKQKPLVKISNMPEWVNYPDSGGRVGVVGYAKQQKSKGLQKKIALITAKARLSERLKINVDDIVTLQYSSKDNKEELHSFSRQTSSNLIRHVIVKDEYVDSDGVLYLWLITQ